MRKLDPTFSAAISRQYVIGIENAIGNPGLMGDRVVVAYRMPVWLACQTGIFFRLPSRDPEHTADVVGVPDRPPGPQVPSRLAEGVVGVNTLCEPPRALRHIVARLPNILCPTKRFFYSSKMPRTMRS